jgi:outer membrane protein
MKKLLSLALVAALSSTAFSALAQDNILKLGVTRYSPNSKTNGITGVGVPPGADADVGGANTVIFEYERMITPNIGLQLVLGIPPRIHAKATGSVAFLGDDVLSAKNVAPTGFVTYHFFGPDTVFRPYVGAGINYTRFAQIRSSLAPKVEMSSSTGWAGEAGGTYAITKNVGIFASIAYLKVKSKLVATGTTVLETTIDFRPVVYSTGITYAF